MGVALWGFVLLLPAVHLGLLAGADRFVRALYAVPLLVLGVAVVRWHALWLLGFFPVSLLLPALRDPELVGQRVYGFPAFLLTAVALAAFLVAVLAAKGGEPAGGVRQKRNAADLLQTGVEAALVVLLGLFAWWGAFDPSVVWTPSPAAEVAALRPYGRTLPVLILVGSWLLVVSAVATPLVGRLATKRESRGEPS